MAPAKGSKQKRRFVRPSSNLPTRYQPPTDPRPILQGRPKTGWVRMTFTPGNNRPVLVSEVNAALAVYLGTGNGYFELLKAEGYGVRTVATSTENTGVWILDELTGIQISDQGTATAPARVGLKYDIPARVIFNVLNDTNKTVVVINQISVLHLLVKAWA